MSSLGHQSQPWRREPVNIAWYDFGKRKHGLIAVYISFPFIHGYVEVDDENGDDGIETRISSHGQGLFYITHHLRMECDASD